MNSNMATVNCCFETGSRNSLWWPELINSLTWFSRKIITIHYGAFIKCHWLKKIVVLKLVHESYMVTWADQPLIWFSMKIITTNYGALIRHLWRKLRQQKNNSNQDGFQFTIIVAIGRLLSNGFQCSFRKSVHSNN